MPEPAQQSRRAQVEAQALPAELETRLAALEAAAERSDFDGSSWFWMMLIGVAIPILLLAIGWWA